MRRPSRFNGRFLRVGIISVEWGWFSIYQNTDVEVEMFWEMYNLLFGSVRGQGRRVCYGLLDCKYSKRHNKTDTYCFNLGFKFGIRGAQQDTNLYLLVHSLFKSVMRFNLDSVKKKWC